ncbi:unnamed protein product [Blepharisma stoltei]|uniref:Uncharacterized protein n=1 Tax=Blepharisma stoltei TaxID=1481888 RepID=A0AAU9J1U2_9CILI|nr:unnamed protein product [Blepharisma stoltei]
MCSNHLTPHCLSSYGHNLIVIKNPEPPKLDESSKRIIVNHLASINTEISAKIGVLIAKTTKHINEMKTNMGLLIEENRISTEKYREIVNFICRSSVFPEHYQQLNIDLLSNQSDCRDLMQNTNFPFYDSVYQEIKKFENFIGNTEQREPSYIEKIPQLTNKNRLENNLIEKSPDDSIHTPDSMKTELGSEQLKQENKKLLEKIRQLEERINRKSSDINELHRDLAVAQKEIDQKTHEKNYILDQFESFKMKFRDFGIHKEKEDKRLNEEIEKLQKEVYLKDKDNQSLKEKLGKIEEELKLRNSDKDIFKKNAEEKPKDESAQENREKHIDKYKKSVDTKSWDKEVVEPPRKSNKANTTDSWDESNEKIKKLTIPQLAGDAWKEIKTPQKHSNQTFNEKSQTTESWDGKDENSKQPKDLKKAEDPWSEADDSKRHSHSRSKEKSHVTEIRDRKNESSKKPIDPKVAEDAWNEAEASRHSHSRSKEKSHTTLSWDRKYESPKKPIDPKAAEDAWNEAEASQKHSHSHSKEKSHTTSSWDRKYETPKKPMDPKAAEDAWNEAEASQKHSSSRENKKSHTTESWDSWAENAPNELKDSKRDSHSRSREKSHTTDSWGSKNEEAKKPTNSRWTRDTDVEIPKKHSDSKSSNKYDHYDSPRKIPKLNSNNEWKCKSIFPGTKTAYFREKSKILRTKNLNELKETEIVTTYEDHELSGLPELISTYIAMCQTSSEVIFCYGNLYNGHATGITFIIEKDFSLIMRDYGRPCFHTSVCYYKGSVYAFGGSNDDGKTKEASRFSFNSNTWKPIADLPEVSNFCTTLAYEDKIYIAGPSLSKIYIYDPHHDTYDIVKEFLEREKPKLLLSLYNKIYLLQSEGDLLVYDGKWNRARNTTELFSKNPSSFRTIYRTNIYFTCGDARYYKFNSNGELGHAFDWI